MVPIADVVALVGCVLHADAVFIEGVDPVAAPIHEPAQGLLLGGPTLVGGDVMALVGPLYAVCQLEEG